VAEGGEEGDNCPTLNLVLLMKHVKKSTFCWKFLSKNAKFGAGLQTPISGHFQGKIVGNLPLSALPSLPSPTF